MILLCVNNIHAQPQRLVFAIRFIVEVLKLGRCGVEGLVVLRTEERVAPRPVKEALTFPELLPEVFGTADALL